MELGPQLPIPHPGTRTCASFACKAAAGRFGIDPVTGHKPFDELTKNFTPQRRARVAAKAAALRETMTLEALRRARSLTQEEVAEALTVDQPAVAKLEKRGDMHVGNLRRYVEALGGTLEITAHFADTTVVITNVGESP